MNKKFLSAILFGALMVTSTGTFVSCKDYDDDIDELWGAVEGQKSELSAKVTAVESSISSLQSAQSGLQSEIAKAKDAAEKAALEAQAAAVAAAAEELAAAKAELVAAIAEAEANNSASVEEVKAAIAEAEEAAAAKMAEVSGSIQTLQAFAVTTSETMEKLAAADTALQTSIKELDAKIAAQAELVGKNTAAINAQIEALKKYQESNDAVVSGAVAEIETALDAMKSAAAAQKKALEDYIAANNASVADNAAAVEALAADIEALQKGQLTEAKVSEIAAQVTKELASKLDLISAAYNKSITHVSLVKVVDANDLINLDLVAAKAVRTWTFGEDMPGAIEFTKDAKETFQKSFVIRVSPTNATVDEGSLQLVNSQMGNLNDLVDIVSIKPYTKLLSRGVSENGLWEVTVKLNKEYDETAYNKATYVYKDGKATAKKILYAVMVADELTSERQVVSEYGVTLGSANKPALRSLNFNVDATPVAEIHNRWNGTDGEAVSEMSQDVVEFEEKTWNLALNEDEAYVYAPWAAPVYKDNPNTAANEINVVNDEDDARNGLAAYSVKAGEAFTVNFNKIEEAANIRGYYVTLDLEDCAVESAPSEMRAWESYDVQGLNEVSSPSTPIELTIPEDAGAEGDYIGFRVYAVNYDGSLVDPDGKAFYVYVGETDKRQSDLYLSISSKVVVPLETVTTSTQDAFSTAKWARAKGGLYELVVKDAAGKNVDVITWDNFKFTYVKDGKDVAVGLLASADKLINDASITKVTKVELINVPASSLKDNMTYTATITAKNEASGIVAVATVKFAKVLPTFPADIKPFTGQVVDGNLMVFPYFDGTDAAYDMTSSWHGIETYVDKDGNEYNVDSEMFIHNVAKNQQLTYDSETNILTAPIGYLKPTAESYLTKFPVKVTYNYGKISYREIEKVWTVADWVTAWGQNLTIQLGNYVNECKYSMNSNLKITYPGAIGKEVYFDLNKIVVKDWYNAAVSLKNIMEQTADTKESKFFAEGFKVEFLTGDKYDIVDEYFTFDRIAEGVIGKDAKGNDIKGDCIYMISKSDAATGNPVTTKVRLTFNDKFGNKIIKVVDGSFVMNYQN